MLGYHLMHFCQKKVIILIHSCKLQHNGFKHINLTILKKHQKLKKLVEHKYGK